MADPKYPTNLDNDPPLLENDWDTVTGEPFVFNSEMVEDIQNILQPDGAATVGTLSEIVLGSDRAPYASLVGVVLASCRIQTGLCKSPPTALPSDNAADPYFCLVPFQEGKFTEPPFVMVQPFDSFSSTPSNGYCQPIQVDRVTKMGFRASMKDTTDTSKFFWIAIQPPFGWKTNGDPVTDDPTTPVWFDGT